MGNVKVIGPRGKGHKGGTRLVRYRNTQQSLSLSFSLSLSLSLSLYIYIYIYILYIYIYIIYIYNIIYSCNGMDFNQGMYLQDND